MASLSRSLALALAAASAMPSAAREELPLPSPGSGPIAPGMESWRPMIAEAARRVAIPEAWIVAVMQVESGGRTFLDGRPITSPAGAMGLMQVMPTTWNTMRAQLGLGSDPYDPRDNIVAGAAYLRLMYERFGYPGLFGAYNAGPARYEAFLRGQGALPAGTRRYIVRLAGMPATPSMPPAVLSGTQLFFALGRARSASAELASRVPTAPHAVVDRNENAPVPDTLFVPLGPPRR